MPVTTYEIVKECRVLTGLPGLSGVLGAKGQRASWPGSARTNQNRLYPLEREIDSCGILDFHWHLRHPLQEKIKKRLSRFSSPVCFCKTLKII